MSKSKQSRRQERPQEEHDDSELGNEVRPSIRSLDDAQLLKIWHTGDAQALETLLRNHQGRLFAVCYRILRDPMQAEDLLQESLVRIIEGLPSFDGRSQVSTWMTRVAMNACLTHIRRQKIRRHGNLEDTAPEHVAAASKPSKSGAANMELEPPSRVIQEQSYDALGRALLTIDPEMRAILMFRDVQDLEYSEIASALEVPLGTIKSRLFRARTALRMALEVELERDD